MVMAVPVVLYPLAWLVSSLVPRLHSSMLYFMQQELSRGARLLGDLIGSAALIYLSVIIQPMSSLPSSLPPDAS